MTRTETHKIKWHIQSKVYNSTVANHFVAHASFVRHDFDTGPLRWYIKFYPYGNYAKNIGNASFILSPLSAKDNIKKLPFKCRISIKETNTTKQKSITFTDINNKSNELLFSNFIPNAKLKDYKKITIQIAITIPIVLDIVEKKVENKMNNKTKKRKRRKKVSTSSAQNIDEIDIDDDSYIDSPTLLIIYALCNFIKTKWILIFRLMLNWLCIVMQKLYQVVSNYNEYPELLQKYNNLREENVNLHKQHEDLRVKMKRFCGEKECIVCMDNDRNVVCIPCGHFVTCDKCHKRMNICPCCQNECSIQKVYQ